MELDYRRTHHHHHHHRVPAFGSWDYEDSLPFTECFESARQAVNAGLLPYDYAEEQEDRDLYVAGDLYQDDVVTPAVIVVPRRRKKKGGYPHDVKEEGRKQQEYEWGGYGGYDIKDSPSPIGQPPSPPTTTAAAAVTTAPKPIDEDLYKISPDLLYSKPKKKRSSGLGFFSSCLLPACV